MLFRHITFAIEIEGYGCTIIICPFCRRIQPPSAVLLVLSTPLIPIWLIQSPVGPGCREPICGSENRLYLSICQAKVNSTENKDNSYFSWTRTTTGAIAANSMAVRQQLSQICYCYCQLAK